MLKQEVCLAIDAKLVKLFYWLSHYKALCIKTITILYITQDNTVS